MIKDAWVMKNKKPIPKPVKIQKSPSKKRTAKPL
jgi:hypothetical protein